MSSDIHSVLVGETIRKASMVARADGSAITSGTVNYYLKALSGANADKWWKNSDQTWAAVETANAMTHQADGCWTITLAASPFTDGVLYLEYAKESGDLHVAAAGRLLRGKAVVDAVNASQIGGTSQTGADVGAATAASAIRTAMGLASANLDTQLSTISGYVDCLPASWTVPLTAAGTRSALGMASADLDTQLDTIASNVAGTQTGARTLTITVTDGTDPLEAARVRITMGADTRVGATNASGQITWSVDDGTWTVTITLVGYTFTPTTLAISANTTHTYEMSQTVTPSADPSQVTGYLYTYDEAGVAESGVIVSLQQTAVAESTGVAYDMTVRTATSDATGLAEFTGLFIGATYKVWRGKGLDQSVTIPAAASDPYELVSVLGRE